MLKHKIETAVLVAALVFASLGLAGCRKQDTAGTATPAAETAPKQQQSLPSVGSDVSPLATPGSALSPVKP